MKKVLMTVFMSTMLPVLGCDTFNYSVVCAEDDIPFETNYPNLAPIYKSYYDYSKNMLYIYGAAESTVVSVQVIYNGCVVLADCVAPEDLPAIYNFSDSNSGTYQVVVYAGSTVLTTFSFVK